MDIIDDILKLANLEVGTTESPRGSNSVKYNAWYYGKPVTGPRYPWCMVFVMWVFNQVGASYLLKKTASCTSLYNWAKDNGRIVENARPGDIVILSWKKNKKPQHVGIVESVDGTTLNTIEGNTSIDSNDNGGAVMRRRRSKENVCAYIRPDYTATKPLKFVRVGCKMPVLKRGDENVYVGILQFILNSVGYDCGSVDSNFGNKTEIAVRKLQTAKNIEPDGIVGAESWGKLLSP